MQAMQARSQYQINKLRFSINSIHLDHEVIVSIEFRTHVCNRERRLDITSRRKTISNTLCGCADMVEKAIYCPTPIDISQHPEALRTYS